MREILHANPQKRSRKKERGESAPAADEQIHLHLPTQTYRSMEKMNPKPTLHMNMVTAAASSSSGGRGAAKRRKHEAMHRRYYKKRGRRRRQRSRAASAHAPRAPPFRPEPHLRFRNLSAPTRTTAVPAASSSSRCRSRSCCFAATFSGSRLRERKQR